MNIHDPLEYIPNYFKVLTKPKLGERPEMIPMTLWPTQLYYAENRTNRDVVLKNRQTGMSTGVMALNDHVLFTQPYERQVLITHDQETSEFLFLTTERFYTNLPDEIKPHRDWKSGTRMRFDKFDSYIYIDSANSDALGIGHTITRAHLSELARWPLRKAGQLFADISQTVSEGGYITAESTPRGRGGVFYDLYQGAKEGDNPFKSFFFPWWNDVTCIREVREPLKYDEDEKLLVEHYKLTPEQIMFRREKIRELSELFFQEYPENDVDCWLSSDISIFDGVALRRYLLNCTEGSKEGNITTWKGAIGGERYVIGVDVAAGSERGDYSVGTVLRVKTNEYVCRFRAKIPPDIFAQEMIRLGHRYNDAMIAVERANHGHVVLKTLLDSNYPNIYYHLDYDSFTGQPTREPGWPTNTKTKPMMIDTLATAVRANDILLWSDNFVNEASSMVWTKGERGTDKVQSLGDYDDEVMSLGVAVMAREQTPLQEEASYSVKSYARI